ncbi:superoxide dismutase family protein [Marinobacter salicampi]|uniref:superoxide dismutase family protein n=1 Tax=Marinobacter salicampi TaxID=435907 RepID=UPI00140CB729|nr:superoxide dismutase family protein [Marinobacter salicampi]
MSTLRQFAIPALCPALWMSLVLATPTLAQEDPEEETAPAKGALSVEMKSVSPAGKGETIGVIEISVTLGGLLFVPQLELLRPGLHGFHVHENANCRTSRKETEPGATAQPVPAGEAGGHLDPGWIGSHEGPYGNGHLGDLPNLYVNEEGIAEHPVFAPRLSVEALEGTALVIHGRPDNYSDDPEENGGSGRRVACGTIRAL